MKGENVSHEISMEERLMAALSHFFGMLVALVIWITQKDKSNFVRFQALQAVGLDAILMVVTLLITPCVMFFTFAGMVISFSKMFQASASDPLTFLLPSATWLIYFLCMMPFGFVYMALRLIAAGSTLAGYNFHYPWLGKKVEGFLES
ncbi:MAG TPA: DUF4870 domain-containing protein [Anaerolineales bacterium]|nr:DUF4870 domain-containing protein [Anaerolineales bacterium]